LTYGPPFASWKVAPLSFKTPPRLDPLRYHFRPSIFPLTDFGGFFYVLRRTTPRNVCKFRDPGLFSASVLQRNLHPRRANSFCSLSLPPPPAALLFFPLTAFAPPTSFPLLIDSPPFSPRGFFSPPFRALQRWLFFFLVNSPFLNGAIPPLSLFFVEVEGLLLDLLST